jgi:hypothetical protein
MAENGIAHPVEVLAASLPLQFYSMAAVVAAGAVALFAWDIGPMKAAEARTRGGQVLWPHSQPMVDPEVLAPPVRTSIPPRAINMILPIGVMVVMMPVALLITARMNHGQWNILRGSGSTAVLWATLLAVGVAWLMLLGQRAFTVER